MRILSLYIPDRLKGPSSSSLVHLIASLLSSKSPMLSLERRAETAKQDAIAEYILVPWKNINIFMRNVIFVLAIWRFKVVKFLAVHS